LGLLQLCLGWVGWLRAHGRTTYVLTPLIDVVPGGAPLGAVEAAELLADARHQADQRDIQRAYARLGSTLSLDDLLRGVLVLEDQGQGLSAAQVRRLEPMLSGAQQEHRELLALQAGILDLERRIDGQLDEALALLPPATSARLEAPRDAAKRGEP